MEDNALQWLLSAVHKEEYLNEGWRTRWRRTTWRRTRTRRRLGPAVARVIVLVGENAQTFHQWASFAHQWYKVTLAKSEEDKSWNWGEGQDRDWDQGSRMARIWIKTITRTKIKIIDRVRIKARLTYWPQQFWNSKLCWGEVDRGRKMIPMLGFARLRTPDPLRSKQSFKLTRLSEADMEKDYQENQNLQGYWQWHVVGLPRLWW